MRRKLYPIPEIADTSRLHRHHTLTAIPYHAEALPFGLYTPVWQSYNVYCHKWETVAIRHERWRVLWI